MNDYQKKLTAYLSIMAQIKQLLRRRIITTDEYAIIDTMFIEKYGLSSFSLFRQNDLISSAS